MRFFSYACSSYRRNAKESETTPTKILCFGEKSYAENDNQAYEKKSRLSQQYRVSS